MNPEHQKSNPHYLYVNGVLIEYDESLPWSDPTNPQRAIEEYKKNTPPLIKLGQGRDDEPSESILLTEILFVGFFTLVWLVIFMVIYYLSGGFR
jgi:hypothetical protein